MKARLVWALLVSGVLAGCASSLPDPVPLESPQGVVDLRSWNFVSGGAVVPQTWLWDADVLWTPAPGRPEGLAEPVALGSPEHGGTLVASLAKRSSVDAWARATARLRVHGDNDQSYALQIGAVPGVLRVWVNGALVLDSAAGAGSLVSVQPRDGILDIVVGIETQDYLVRHSELNRVWLLGPSQTLLGLEKAERMSRSFQAMFLLLAALLFFAMALLRPHRHSLAPFVPFLAVCFLKLVFNVEQAEPFLTPFFPSFSPSVALFLNHGLNLLPFPLMALFLLRQFPQEFSTRSLVILSTVTAVATGWELLPFLLLAAGMVQGYETVMHWPWALVLNLYVLIVVLFLFERIYQTWAKKRPLSGALFLGGIAIGLIILLPILLSYFFSVKFTFFLGWGLIFFLSVLGYELLRLQVQTSDNEIAQLRADVESGRSLGRFLSPRWALRLGRALPDAPRPGDRKSAEVVLVQVTSPDASSIWLPVAGRTAETRHALLAEWHDHTGLWVTDEWSESGLVLALDLQKDLGALRGLRYRIVVTRARVEMRVEDAGPSWVAFLEGLPHQRLAELDALADRAGARVVLDDAVKDGLVIGGWRRHRHLSLGRREIELYEGEDESLSQMKDKTLDRFEAALARGREGNLEHAIQEMLAVVRQNPFDLAARALLAEWNHRKP